MVYTRKHTLMCNVYTTHTIQVFLLNVSLLVVYHSHTCTHAYGAHTRRHPPLLSLYFVVIWYCCVLCCSFRSSFLSTDFYYIRTFVYISFSRFSVVFIYLFLIHFLCIFQHTSLPLLFLSFYFDFHCSVRFGCFMKPPQERVENKVYPN